MKPNPFPRRPFFKGFFYALLFFALFPPVPQAATDVPALLTVDTRWDADHGPYLIRGRVLVPRGATLRLGPGVRLIFEARAQLWVQGRLFAAGSTVAPVIFDMRKTGTQGGLFVLGGGASFVQTKLAGGWFLVRDGGLRLDSSEVFGGTGVYLQGRTSALLTGNKIMGNSVGITTAGRLVRLSGFFNRIAKNSYGLYLKEWGSLDLRDNSLQDNAWEIVNLTAQPAPLAGNYWGGLGSAEVTPKCRGKGILEPLKGMEEVYLDYYKAHYPKMSEEQAKALAANWKRTNKERSADKAGTQAPAGPAAAEASTETDPSKAADLNSLDLNGIPL